MNKKILILIVLFSLMYMSVQAQQWLDLLPENKTRQELTLKDHKKAFDTYWESYNVKNGYYYENGVKKKAYGWKQFMRWHYDMQYQVDAQTGVFPEKTAQQVYDEFKQTHSNTRSDIYQADWVSLGTNFSYGGYAGIGRINAIAFHPTDNNTYWVAAPSGGLWVTYEDGNSWTCLTDNNQILGISDIIIPSDYETSQTIYIATGDRDAWDNRSIGVLKSTDGGATWNTTGLQFTLNQGQNVYRLLLDPNNDQIIIAATHNGVYKTTDGGNNWSKLNNYSFIDLEYKPGDFSTLYGSTQYGKIYQSTDTGSTWSLVHSENNGYRIELAVTPANPNLLIALISNSQGGLHSIYKSDDNANSFSMLLDGNTQNLLDWYAAASGSSGQGWYDLSLAISPTNQDIIFVGGVNTWKSVDGGTTWNLSNHWYGENGIQAVHADKHSLKYRDNGDLFEGNDGGIYISQDNGDSWEDKSNGLVISQIYKLGVAAQEEAKIITGLQDNGTKLFENNDWYDVKGGDGMECLIDYTNSEIQYGSYVRGQISRTTDNWMSAEDIEPVAAGDGAWVTPYIISPTNHNTLYAGYSDVWKTTDMGNSWTKISSFNTSDKIRSLAIAPSNESVLYAADFSSLWKTTNDGATWQSLPNPASSSSITYITVKNDDANHLWLTFSGYNTHGVYESKDGGSTWTNISDGLPQIPIYTIVQNKQITGEIHLYAGTELGVYFKKGNNDWVEYNEGLPNVKCGELEIYYDNYNPSDSRLYLASYGRGLWATPLVPNVVLPPTADFSAESLHVCTGSIVNFTDLSENNPSSWSWNFGDGTSTVTIQNPSHIYNTSGTYNVSLTVSNYLGQDTKTIDNYITVVQAPNAGINGTLDICEGTTPSENDLFNALGGTPDTGGTWTNSGLVFTYTVTVSCGADSSTVTGVEIPLPEAHFTIDSLSLPKFVFTNTSNHADTYLWDLGDGTTATTTDAEHIYTANGTYTVVLKASNDCASLNYEKSLTINDIEKIKLYPNPANDYVKINLGAYYQQVKSVSVLDNLGAKILCIENINQPIVYLSTRNLSSGVYLINILKENESIGLKLMVIRD